MAASNLAAEITVTTTGNVKKTTSGGDWVFRYEIYIYTYIYSECYMIGGAMFLCTSITDSRLWAEDTMWKGWGKL